MRSVPMTSVRCGSWLVGASLLLSLGLRGPDVCGFSLDDPAGPAFPGAVKQAQREAGRRIVPLVAEACRSGVASVRIPPGDYRFGCGSRSRTGKGNTYGLEFSGLQRSADHPLTIEAAGVTFWLDLPLDQTTPKFGVGFKDCSYLTLQGATIDSDTRGHLEGRITQLDFAGNRIELQLSPGLTLPQRFNDGVNQRLLPFKADGRFCAPLYALQKGGRHLRYQTPQPGTAPGRVWIPLADTALLDTIRQPQWQAAYGDLGIIGVGDGLCCIYSTVRALALVNSSHLTMSRINLHVVKGFFSEEGGEGAHLWTSCYFGPRPGTCLGQGGGGSMINATRRGTTFDRVTILHSEDDPVNIHGYWDEVASVSNNAITLVAQPRPGGRLVKAAPRPGDRLRFYDKKTGALAGSATIAAVNGSTLTLKESAAGWAGMVVESVDQECGGWTIRDCEFRDCYQRLMIQAGPGTVSGCRFTRMGNGLELNSVLSYVEGGVPRDIVIAGNTFDWVNPQPGGAAISVHARGFDRGAATWMRGITITNNVFRTPGDTAIALSQIDGGLIGGNRIERTGSAQPRADAIVLGNCRNIVVGENRVTAREEKRHE